MKAILNNGQELQIQSAGTQADGQLLIKTISAGEEELKTMFQDELNTKKITITVRDATQEVYENYTKLDAIVKYTAGILGVILYKVGETPSDRIAALEAEKATLQDQVDMLQRCILEMSELVYK